MRRPSFIILLLVTLSCKAQIVFRTAVPQLIVEAGKPFNISYVLENAGSSGEFIGPAFTDLRWVSGPTLRRGLSNGTNLYNYVFTVVAPRAGQYVVPAATINVEGRLYQSASKIITAIAPGAEDESEYFLRPGEDADAKIRRNLFMTVKANRTSCYVGEPIVATFKLYSRLQSKSDIVKNPGFYGFTVHDVYNLNDNLSTVETINGKTFAVHTVRTVQLYPLQPGDFSIDPMEVANRVEFSKSAVTKRTEQEIREGVFDSDNSENKSQGTLVYENHISTEKIAVHVKPYPDKGKPASFTGATGRFFIHASLEKGELQKNEEGDLLITVSGAGNFSQLSAPSIQWPEGVESFDPVISDSLDARSVPLTGKRTFRFPFIASKPGIFQIAPVSFSYFDVDSNRYRELSSAPLDLKISYLEKERNDLSSDTPRHTTSPPVQWWIIGGLLFLTAALVGWLLIKKRQAKPAVKAPVRKHLLVEEVLMPVYPALKTDDVAFYSLLQKAIWEYLGSVLGLSGSTMSKSVLSMQLHQKGVPPAISGQIFGILEACEAAAFTTAEFAYNKQELLLNTKRLLEQVN